MAMRLRPMLATLVEEPFDKKGWIFEIKWDGFRIMAPVERGRVRLVSRGGQDYTELFAPVAAALRKMRHRAVLDGEVVALDRRGRASFGGLRDWRIDKGLTLVYAVFDLLELDGKDRRGKPLLERKKLLKRVLPTSRHLKFSSHIETRGTAFFRAAERKGLEGIMAKDASSPYRSGIRSREWFKIKTHLRQEVVIGGFTAPRRGRKGFGALVVGVYEKKKLRYVGHVGGGFDTKGLLAMHHRLLRLARATSPFADAFPTNAPVTWVKPVLVGEVSFAEWTGDGHLRQPIFVGLREDKKPAAVRRERAVRGQPRL